MDLSDIEPLPLAILAEHLSRGLAAFGVPDPMTLEEHAAKHFYLSAESSYVERSWQAWPYQRAIMACISDDAITEIDWPKSARTGNTKIMLAAICYFAEHRRRNQVMFQPTDDDRTEFVKTELDPVLRDVPVMQKVFPAYLRRHKDNTLQQKNFLGSILHLRGGKAAKNYRRISVDVVYIDEIDAFDRDIENEGDPFTLAAKRVEGATFPKIVVGSTPKTKGFSLICDRSDLADERFEFVIPCPSCSTELPITWGGKDQPHGFKWQKDAAGEPIPETVRHQCPHCDARFTQGDYLSVWHLGYYRNEDRSIVLTADGKFHDRAGRPVAAPRHIAFIGVWTAYSPAATWANIVRDFAAAHRKSEQGDKSALKAFTNTTLGRAWEEDLEKTEAREIQARAEPYQLGTVPMGCLLLLAAVDTQDNRLEITIRGYGRGCETWTIAHEIFYGSPGADDVWTELENLLFNTEFPHAAGTQLRIHATAIDVGGHFTQAVYHFCFTHRQRNVFAVRGASDRERNIKHSVSKVDLDYRGRYRKRGVLLWYVGTNLAKDLLHARNELTKPGPGYMHHSSELPDEWFLQLTGEARAEQEGRRGRETRWTKLRKRVEALDCAVYCVWLETHLELTRKPDRYWQALADVVQPENGDLFAVPSIHPKSLPPKPSPVGTGISLSGWKR